MLLRERTRFPHWSEQLITPNPRYDQLINEMKDVARSNLIFGLHVHVGIPDREEGLQIMNVARYFPPTLYTHSLPIRHSGKVGIRVLNPSDRRFLINFRVREYRLNFSSVAEYDKFVEILVKTNCIDNGKKIWWDIRLHPILPYS